MATATATVTVSYYGAHSIADCNKMGAKKLRIISMAADTRGRIMLKKAVAAYNRGEDSFCIAAGDCFRFTIAPGSSGLFM